jgi:hypothetical protein
MVTPSGSDRVQVGDGLQRTAAPGESLTPVGPAIIGLVGVVVGAVISSGFQWVASTRDSNRRQRTAARVIRDELLWWRAGVDEALKHKDPARLPARDDLFAAWKHYRSDLAALSAWDWATIQRALRRAEIYGDDEARGASWTESVGRDLEQTLRDVADATDLLAIAGCDSRLDVWRIRKEIAESPSYMEPQLGYDGDRI